MCPPNERTAAFSLVYLTQEIALVTGPLLIAALVGFGRWGGADHGRDHQRRGDGRHSPRSARPRRRPTKQPARTAGGRATSMPAVLAVAFLLGSMLGVFQVAAPSLAIARGLPAIGGVLIAAVSVGGISGAVLYGAFRWKADPAIALDPFSWRCLPWRRQRSSPCSPRSRRALLAVGGLALNPAFATTSLLIDRHGGSRGAEAFGWMSTAGGSRDRGRQRGCGSARAAQRLSAGVLRGCGRGLRRGADQLFSSLAFSVANSSSVRTPAAWRSATFFN